MKRFLPINGSLSIPGLNISRYIRSYLSFSTKVELNRKKTVGKSVEDKNFKTSLSGLSPGYFALVMATGIVSISAQYCGLSIIADVLLYINIIAYLILLILNILRLILFTKECITDFLNPMKSPGYLTFVAGSCVLGTQLHLVWSAFFWSVLLYFLALAAWLILIYAFFTMVTVEHKKPTIRRSISGSWLLAVVSTQAVCILGTLLSNYLPLNPEHVYFFSLILFFCGSMFYLVVITFIMYRMSFLEFEPGEFAPSYWINMGAVAITTLAGTLLLSNSQNWLFLKSLIPFIKGFTLFFWAICSWWIPFIVILDIWRYIVKGLPLNYQSQNWDIVFPLGMYTACTVELIRVMHIPFLSGIPSVFIYISLLGWCFTFLGLIRNIGIILLKSIR